MEAFKFWEVIYNPVMFPAFLAWISSQLIKAPIAVFLTKKRGWRIIFSTGGMPSSHTAFTMEIAVSTGLNAGWTSIAFAIALAFAIVVMYDAAGVRQAAGKQAAVLNDIVEHMEETGQFVITKEKLREFLGHTPVEVIVGALFGTAVSVVYYLYTV